MELTQMVSDDGSVVDLRAEPRPSLVKFDDEPADQPPDAAGEDDDETAVVEPLVPEGTRVHADLVDEDEERLDFDAEETESGAAETVPEVPANSEPEDAAEMDEAQEAPPSPVRDGLVSAEVAAAATAAMSRLKSSLAAGAPVGGGKTLEALVCEAMTPHLKAWLDENLPDLVERVVREEIKKMVQQADRH
jgi:cell pole-organizing protein PopZ